MASDLYIAVYGRDGSKGVMSNTSWMDLGQLREKARHARDIRAVLDGEA